MLTQSQAKVLIRDYLRATGRKGVTSLIRDLRKFHKSIAFSQRTLEKWLKQQDRMLQDDNWLPVQEFVLSDQFSALVPYARSLRSNERLPQVAEGLMALYQPPKDDERVVQLPSSRTASGIEAIQHLEGYWENVPNLKDRDIPRTICAIEPVDGAPYAKFAYIALFRSRQVSTTGLVIYTKSEDLAEYDYCHHFVLQLWRRKDPETGTAMPGELTYRKLAKRQPELSVSNVVNRYFYKETNPHIGDPVILRLAKDPIPEECEIIDSMLTDVLPHGFT